MQKASPLPAHNVEVMDYLTLNGFEFHPNGIIPEAMVFMRTINSVGMALIILDDSIDVKIKMESDVVNAPQILFNWESTRHYKGWDGKNMFQFMMLMDFMEVVKLRDVAKEIRTKITTENLIMELNAAYNTEAVKNVA